MAEPIKRKEGTLKARRVANPRSVHSRKRKIGTLLRKLMFGPNAS